MFISYNWLKELIPLKISAEKLAEKLTLAGFEVEKIHYLGKGLDKAVVGEILEIKPHPQADKLVLTKVDIGKQILEIICGATNIKIGQKVPVALIGAKLANGLVIQKTKIRGIESEGMLCAEDELGLGEGHQEILILEQKLKLGESLQKVFNLDDIVLEINLPANRGDLCSHLGIAREISALINEKVFSFKDYLKKNKLDHLDLNRTEQSSKINELLEIKVEDYDLCAKYTAKVVQDIEIKDSPQWLKTRLIAAGLHPVNNVVDATNYVMLELGQPLHAFDLEKISGIQNQKLVLDHDRGSKIKNQKYKLKIKNIIIRKAKKGERILTLDEKEKELDNSMLVIADNKKPIAIAGVMGGKQSEISQKTKSIILESAQFNPSSIRRTSRELGLRSESSIRFEKNVDWRITEVALEKAAQLIAQIANGKIAEGGIFLTPKPIYLRQVIKLPFSAPAKLLGIDLDKQIIKDILSSLGLIVSEFSYEQKVTAQSIDQLVDFAKFLVGRKYKFGATIEQAPEYFDCSSLTQYIYQQINVNIPRSSIEQIEIGEPVEKNALLPGDLIFLQNENHQQFNFHYPRGVGHLGFYIGGGKIIHATNKDQQSVLEEDLEKVIKKLKWVSARRVITENLAEPYFLITVPSYRQDLVLTEDLIEEIGRTYDYNKMLPTFLKAEIKPINLSKEQLIEEKIKNYLVGLGFDEVYNYSFQGEIEPDDYAKYWQLLNPLNPEQKYLRCSLMPHLTQNLEKNLKNFEEVRIFEIGKIFEINKEEMPVEKVKLGMAISAKNNIEDSFADLKGAWEALTNALQINADLFDCVYSQNIIEIKIKNDLLGQMKIIEKDNHTLAVLEADLEILDKYVDLEKKYQIFSLYPKVRRDIAIVLEGKVAYLEIEKAIKSINPLIKAVELFDIFESEKLGKNKKSLAFHLDFQSNDCTLTSEKVDAVFAQIVKVLNKKFHAVLRE